MITGFGTSLVMVATVFGIYSGWMAEQELSATMHHSIVIEEEFININIDFKNQIQEWKNVLIRGSDDEQRKKYWDNFLNKHAAVQAETDKLIADVSNKALEQILAEFKMQHAQLLPLYKKGFTVFVESGYERGKGH